MTICVGTYRVCSQHRRGEDRVGIDQVVEKTQEDKHHAEAEGHSGNDADDPVDARVVCPSEPEETNRQGGRREKRRWETCFGWRETVVLIADLGVALVVPDGVGDREDHAHSNTQEGQATDSGAPATNLLVPRIREISSAYASNSRSTRDLLQSPRETISENTHTIGKAPKSMYSVPYTMAM